MSRLIRFLAVASLVATVAACAMPAAEQAGSPSTHKNRFLVYFEPWSAALSPNAQTVVADAARAARATKVRAIRIEARASAVGSVEANKRIAQARSQIISDQLQVNGLSTAMLRQVPIGETGSGDPSVTDRRVDIVLEP